MLPINKISIKCYLVYCAFHYIPRSKSLSHFATVIQGGFAVGWIIAILIAGMAIAGLVGGSVLHPFLYGLFIASILIVPFWLGSSIVGSIINAIFRKKS